MICLLVPRPELCHPSCTVNTGIGWTPGDQLDHLFFYYLTANPLVAISLEICASSPGSITFLFMEVVTFSLIIQLNDGVGLCVQIILV